MNDGLLSSQDDHKKRDHGLELLYYTRISSRTTGKETKMYHSVFVPNNRPVEQLSRLFVSSNERGVFEYGDRKHHHNCREADVADSTTETCVDTSSNDLDPFERVV